MKSTMSKSKSETDEETPSKETLARRRDRKLKDDITNMMVGEISIPRCLSTLLVSRLTNIRPDYFNYLILSYYVHGL